MKETKNNNSNNNKKKTEKKLLLKWNKKHCNTTATTTTFRIRIESTFVNDSIEIVNIKKRMKCFDREIVKFCHNS